MAYNQGVMQMGYIRGNDFNTYMAPLSLNVRVDNTLKDNHYYEYIEEIKLINPLGNPNPKVKKTYGSPYTNNFDVPYDKQKMVWIKGWDRASFPLTLAITNNINRRDEIQLLKLEKFETATSLPYETTSYDWTSTSNIIYSNRNVAYAEMILETYEYPVWEKALLNGNYDGLIQMNRPSGIVDLWLHNIVNYIASPPTSSPFLTELISILSNINTINTSCNDVGDIEFVKDDLYKVEGQELRRQQSIRLNVIKETRIYKNIETNTYFTYEPTFNLLKTTTVENSKYMDLTGNTIVPKTISELTYAFEDYNGISSKFINHHMLNQVTQTKQYAGTNANLLKANVQTWDLGNAINPNTVPTPKASYVFNGVINNDGKILNFSPFDFNPNNTNNDKWQIQNEGILNNQYGQPTLTKTNNIYTKNVFGYSSSQPKAVISYTKGKFDATYTGFEDHFDNDLPYELGDKNEEEFWYEQNSFDPNFTSYIVPVWLNTTGSLPKNPYIPNSLFVQSSDIPCAFDYFFQQEVNGYGAYYYRVFYINNDDYKLKVNDQITIKMNLDFPFSPTVPDFTTTIEDIKYFDPLPYTNFGSIATCSIFFPNFCVDDFNGKYKHMICFSDPIPPIMLDMLNNGNGFKLTGMIIEKSPEPRDSRITHTEHHTGNSSYYLSHKNLAGDASQKTPVRAVKINKLGE